jgi:acyl-CoA synthetase (AMP-forming)/AMP-acid ligase II
MSFASHLQETTATEPTRPRYRLVSEILQARAAETPNREAFSFLHDGKVEGAEVITYGALDARARRLAAELVKVGRDERACLLLLAPGLDFVAAFFACIYANKTVVALPFRPGRNTPHVERELLAIANKSRARLVVANRGARAFAEAVGLRSGSAPDDYVFVDAADDTTRESLSRLVPSDPAAMISMQFTSGSTSTPKGVMVPHQSVLHNLAAHEALYAFDAESRSVMWAPHYHDMGLMLGVLRPIYSGFPGTLMSPLDFVRNPGCWLEAIDGLRATSTSAPNFAYELCVRQPPERVDLRSLRVAECGAEPIAPSTMERFADRFGPFGFDPGALSPVYGLTENSLIATGTPPGRGPLYLDLAKSKVRPADLAGVERLVSCGRAVNGTEVRIVDPSRREVLAEGVTGEVWLRGTSVAHGYWDDEETTREVFGASLASGAGPWLRTGDLGFMIDGELYVSGRWKESIIRNGVKYSPAAVEQVAESRGSLRGSRSVAFAVTRPGGSDQVVLMTEMGEAVADAENELAIIAEDVFRECGLQLDHALFVAPGTVQQTSSGKRMRLDCRRRYLAGEIEALSSYRPRGFRP